MLHTIGLIFLKNALFLTLIRFMFVTVFPGNAAPYSSTTYSPTSCSVTNYDFTFIYDENERVFKAHGLWPEQCSECLTCGYPSCCNTGNMSYVYPSDPNQIAFLNARWFNATTREECFDKSDDVPLFEHEFFKHASCTPLRQSASEFVEQVMRLYDEYYVTHVENQCAGHNQLWLNLDGNFAYNNITKCI